MSIRFSSFLIVKALPQGISNLRKRRWIQQGALKFWPVSWNDYAGYDPSTLNKVQCFFFFSWQYSPPHNQYFQTVPGKKGVVQIEHPQYLPDLNTSDFFLLPRLKLVLKGKRFDNIPNIQWNVARLLNTIPKEDFLQSLQDMYGRSQQCIVMGDDNFEGH